MHLMDWHMMIAELGGYQGAVNPNDGTTSRPEQDEGQSGLWNALVNNRASPRNKLAGTAWGRQSYAIDWPNKLVWSVRATGSQNNANISLNRQIYGHWWPPRHGDNDQYLTHQHLIWTNGTSGYSSSSDSLLFNIKDDPNERSPTAVGTGISSTVFASLSSLLATTASYVSPSGDTAQCVYTASCTAGTDRAAIDGARMNALTAARRSLITTACPSANSRTNAAFVCLADKNWCTAG